MVGQSIEHYRILERIGAGGMGVVYRARDERLGRDVAVKVLAPGADEAARRRFRREALTLSQLNHPNIATIHDYRSPPGGDVLVMELVPGRPLADRLRDGALPLDELAPFALQIARGLAAAHEAGIVHRDLKPQNIHVTPDGRVKILDFGLAQLAPERAAELTTMTGAGAPEALAGTLPYLAPELLRGAPPDARSDVYAAGAVLYEMATGRRLFPDREGVALFAALLADRPPPPSSVNPAVPPVWEHVILKALDRDPERRYRS
ncbi:MAG TPA: serine/threonine-protein kinase, partial [Vicinamibacterales bacterium]|nr:serine/threonine-protein kinase [Vicinamibacterales bacterium]